MADWNDIKKAFERDAKKAEETYADLEQKLLNAVANFVCSQKGLSSIQGYNPADILAFLEKTPSEVKALLGADWLTVDDAKMENLIYSLSKKVQKSNSLIPW